MRCIFFRWKWRKSSVCLCTWPDFIIFLVNYWWYLISHQHFVTVKNKKFNMITFCWFKGATRRTTATIGRLCFGSASDFIMIFCAGNQTKNVKNTVAYATILFLIWNMITRRRIELSCVCIINNRGRILKPKNINYKHCAVEIKQKKALFSILLTIHSCSPINIIERFLHLINKVTEKNIDFIIWKKRLLNNIIKYWNVLLNVLHQITPSFNLIKNTSNFSTWRKCSHILSGWFF
jgi:hypothetical protein